MKIEQFLESEKSREDDSRPVSLNSRRKQGRTVGDGMVGAAKVAAYTTIGSLLVSMAPAFLTVFAGSLFIFRSCDRPSPIPLASKSYVIPQQPGASTSVSAMPMPMLGNTSQGISAGVNTFSNLERSRGELVAPKFESRSLELATSAISELPRFGSNQADDELMGVIRESSSNNAAVQFEGSPLFNFQRGKTFIGTCQMPSGPSKRVSLTIDSIQENGSRISAKLSLLQGEIKTRAYEGFIEKNPPRLVLKPVSNPTSFGMFLTYMPWYSDSPTNIALQISDDGKTLAGTSASSEMFELLPKPEQIRSTASHFEDTVNLLEFDSEGPGSTAWNLQKITGASMNANSSQQWIFTSVRAGVGGFRWVQDEDTIALGTYQEDFEKNQLDITWINNGVTSKFCGRIEIISEPALRVRVCLPKDARQQRPETISVRCGKIYELIRAEEEGGES